MINIGKLTLTQRADGTLWVRHAAVAGEIEVNGAQLARWLLRLFREVIVA